MMFGEADKWLVMLAPELPTPLPGIAVRVGPEEFPTVLRHDRVL